MPCGRIEQTKSYHAWEMKDVDSIYACVFNMFLQKKEQRTLQRLFLISIGCFHLSLNNNSYFFVRKKNSYFSFHPSHAPPGAYLCRVGGLNKQTSYHAWEMKDLDSIYMHAYSICSFKTKNKGHKSIDSSAHTRRKAWRKPIHHSLRLKWLNWSVRVRTKNMSNCTDLQESGLN
jgi:hypothetical protein